MTSISTRIPLILNSMAGVIVRLSRSAVQGGARGCFAQMGNCERLLGLERK